jgi:oligopeptide transport system substrate-binding protein
MRGTTRTVAVAAMSAVALLAAGCGSGDSEPEATTEAKTGGEITVRGCNPENPLVPATPTRPAVATSSTRSLAKLVHYNSETPSPRWTSRSRSRPRTTRTSPSSSRGLQVPRRHRGQGQELRRRVELRRVRPERPELRLLLRAHRGLRRHGVRRSRPRTRDPRTSRARSAKAKEMSGLKVVDDHTFTIKTTEKVSNLPVRVGYSAFAPLPDSFFADPEGLRQQADRRRPVQDGLLDQGQSIELVKNRRLLRRLRRQGRQDHLQDLPGPDAAYNDVIANKTRHHRRDPGERPHRRQVQVGPARPQRAEGDRRHPDGHLPPVKADPNYANPKIRAGDLDGDRPRDDHQEDLQQHPPPPPAGSPRSSTATRPTSVASTAPTTRRRPRPARTRPAATTARSPSSYNADGATRSGPRPPATAIKDASGSSASHRCRRLRHVPYRDRRAQDEGHVPHRLADGLPVDRELPRPDLRHGRRSNDGDYSNGKFDTLIKEGRGRDPCESNAKYQEAEAHARGRLPEHPDVVRQDHWAGPRRSTERQDHRLRHDRPRSVTMK